MRSARKAQIKHEALLAEMALDALLGSPHLDAEHAAFISGLSIQAAQGIALRLDQVARVSKIRGDIAKRTVMTETMNSEITYTPDDAA